MSSVRDLKAFDVAFCVPRTGIVRGLCAFALAALLLPAPARGQEAAEAPPGIADVAASLAVEPAAAEAPPAGSTDVEAWLDYKWRSQRFALPHEARNLYRRGLLARDSGAVDASIHLMRGASALDPHFVAPHATLVQWFALQQPGLAMAEVAKIVQIARDSFVFQLSLAANAYDLLLRAMFLALLVVGFALFALRNAELRHFWQEMLGLHLSGWSARLWPWALLAVPFLFGLGLALPTIVFLALLWPVLRIRERVFLVVWTAFLCSLPFATGALQRLSHPLDDGRGPLYGVHALSHEGTDDRTTARLAARAASEPGNPYVAFGLGWAARQAGDLQTAETSYRHALQLWPGDDRVQNNLGNVLALQGRFDEAMELYRSAVASHPDNAAAYLNMSLVHTHAFDFRAASEAISHAWALDFDLSQEVHERTEGGLLPFTDVWLAPSRLWPAMRETPASADPALLPPMWRGRIETRFGFAIAILVGVILGIVLGTVQHRWLPLHHCSNCGRVVCRRCGERRRASAFCPSCAEALYDARAYEFAQALLARHRRRMDRRWRPLRTAAAALVPGLGLLILNRVGTPLVMMTLTAGFLLVETVGPSTFGYEPQVGPGGFLGAYAAYIGLGLVYLWSLAAYFILRAHRDRLEEAGMPTPTPRRRPAAATEHQPESAEEAA